MPVFAAKKWDSVNVAGLLQPEYLDRISIHLELLICCNFGKIFTSVTLARLTHIIPTGLRAPWALVELVIISHPMVYKEVLQQS